MFNRSYNHKDVLTRASITIQILEDVALYKAQLFSSNGNIFSSSDESSELYVRVYKGLDDITSKFTDIIWKRFTSNSDNIEEDLAWGDKYSGKTDITITKDDIKQKANIQVEIYSLINGERTLVAADFITFININDMQGSDLPPENPKHGDLWLDTSVTPPRLMMWDSNLGMWVEVAIAGRDRRNLIRHSNFYRKNFDYWNNVNNSILEIESMSGKKWAHIKSNIVQNDYCGISQIVNANAKGQYSFQMLSEIYIQSAYPNGDALVAFYSINSLGTKTLIKEETFDLKTDEKVFTSTFNALEDTKQIEVIISGQKNTNFDFVVTNIKLENHPIPTEWELAIEDMQDALDQKVGNTPEEVFDSLTDGGKMQGIYVDIDEHGQKNYYISGRYIDAYNLVVRRKKDNIETLKVDEEGNVSLRVNNLQIISDTGECINTATENDINTIDNKVQTVKDSVAQINLDMNGITQRVSATETTTTNLNNKIDNIQIGGRNFLRNTSNTYTTKTVTGWQYYLYTIELNDSSLLKPNDEVTLRAYLKPSTYNCGLMLHYDRSSGGYIQRSSSLFINGTEEGYTSITMNIPSDAIRLKVALRHSKGDTPAQQVQFKELKLEKGNKATDWTPAPEDVSAEISAVDSKTTTINNRVNEITTNLDGITQRVSNTETTTTNLTNKFNNLQIGGTNLFKQTKEYSGSVWDNNSGTAFDGGEYKGLKVLRFKQQWARRGQTISCEPNITYTLSAYVKGGSEETSPTKIGFYGNNLNGQGHNFSHNQLAPRDWERIAYTFTTPDTATSMIVRFEPFTDNYQSNTPDLYICGLKLEKGNKPTDWSPASEDVQNEIDINIGLGKWRREVYDVSLINASTYPTFENIVGLKPTYLDEFTDNITMLTGISASDTYIVSFKTNAYVSTAKTVTLTPSVAVDDTLTAYVNGIEVGRANNTEAINLSLKQGWNSIALLFYEHTGGEVLSFRTKLSDMVDKIAYGINSNNMDESITTVSSRVSQIKTDLSGITNTVSNLQTISTDIARAMSGGKMLNTDPLFKNGNNGINLYNNANNGVTKVERIAKVSDCPTNSTHCLKITTTGAANPGFGGFYFGTGTKANKVFITKILAKIPTGRAIYFASNAYGTGGQQKWLTPTAGTGKWEEYLCQVRCGDSGSFSSTNFFYLSGGSTPTTSSPLEWYVGYATVIDITDSEEIETRLKAAEQKITDEAITNTVKQNFYTKGDVDSKGYQTQSDVQQTVNQLQIKFTESGGYNLLRNGSAKNGIKYWYSNGGGISLYDNSNITGFETTFPSGIVGDWIKLKNNTDYIYSAYVFSANAYNGSWNVPLHFWCSTNQSAGATQCVSVTYDQTLVANGWKKIYTHIRTKATGDVWFKPFIYTGGSMTGRVIVTELGLYESKLPLPWAPHPSEIYDGITTIDKDGIIVTSSNVKSKTSMTASGFKITKTDTNEDVFKVNADGTLVMKGSITVTGGSVPTSNLTGTITANMISANAITSDKIAANAITADKITAGTITADKLKIQARDSFSINPNFSLWSSTYPYGMSSWSSSTCTKVVVDNRSVLQYAVTTAATQMGAVLNTSYFNAGLNLDGMQYIGLEVKYRLTSGTNPAGACMLLDINYTDGTSERLNLSLKSINSSVTTNTWYTARKVFKVSNITKTFKSVSGYLLANWSSETNTVKTIQFASANAYACTEQDYLTQTWSSGTEINGAKIKTGTLSADKITTGTLDASKITVTNLNASSITTGTLSGGYNKIRNSKIMETSNVYGFGGRSVDASLMASGNTYTFTVNGRTVNGVGGKYCVIYLYDKDWNWSISISIPETTDTTKSKTFTLPSNILPENLRVSCYHYPNGGDRSGSSRVNWVSLTDGTLSHPWSPHPSEIYDGITRIDKDGITVTSSNVKSKTSMTANGFKIIKTDTNEEVFKVNSDGTLTLKGSMTITSGSVSDNAISSTIKNGAANGNTAKSRVDGWTYSGTTEINGASIRTGSLSADKITTGTLDASKVSVTNLNAGNITSGTISGDRIRGGTITAAVEINFQGGARIFGTTGAYGAGLSISAQEFRFSGGSDYYMDNNPVLTAKTANGYPGLSYNRNDSNWIRTTSNGLIPYQSGGASSLGTSSWPFNNIYGKNIYENGTSLSSKYFPKSGGTISGSVIKITGNQTYYANYFNALSGNVYQGNKGAMVIENNDLGRFHFLSSSGLPGYLYGYSFTSKTRMLSSTFTLEKEKSIMTEFNPFNILDKFIAIDIDNQRTLIPVTQTLSEYDEENLNTEYIKAETDKNGEIIITTNNNGMITLLTEAVKELKKENESLNNKLNNLEIQLNELIKQKNN